MKFVMFLSSVILAAFASPLSPNLSQYKSSASYDVISEDLDVVIWDFGDKSVFNLPPKYLNTLNISNLYDVNCYNDTLGNATLLICEYGDVNVIYWPEELWNASTGISVNVLPTVLAAEPKTPEQITDELLFHTPLDVFISRRQRKDPSSLIWASDDCTHAPDEPFGLDFFKACQRHDFGYHNYRAQKRLNKTAKVKIDDLFNAE